jgi:hypothetical protein
LVLNFKTTSPTTTHLPTSPTLDGLDDLSLLF